MHYLKQIVTLLCLIGISLSLCGQDTATRQLSSGYLSKVSTRINHLSGQVDKKNQKLLSSLKKSEQRIYKKLLRKDTIKAKAFLLSSDAKYAALKQTIAAKASPFNYIPSLDTLKTSLEFLQNSGDFLSQAKGTDKKVENALAGVKQLQEQLGKTESIKAFLKERKKYLQDQLKDMGFARELKKLNKQAYYYAAQVNGYKELIKDKKKLERRAMELLGKSKPFQDFMRRNSQLAGLFPMPGGRDGSSAASLAGLQTRASVQEALTQRFGSGTAVTQALQQNVQAAQGELNALKAKAKSYSSGSFDNASGDMEMPEGFKPNRQKTKSFLKRLEYGTNFQTERSNSFYPTTTDVALAVGYKLNDKSIIGIGASYKIGWGRDLQHIALSSEGAGFRSNLDIKMKGSFHATGGFEYNYQTPFASLQQVERLNDWQQSGLLGVSKIVSMKTKFFKKSSIQLLWDFLSYQQLPQTKAFKFRIGYKL